MTSKTGHIAWTMLIAIQLPAASAGQFAAQFPAMRPPMVGRQARPVPQKATEEKSVAATVRLIETKQDSEKAFQHDLVARGLVAVILKLTNESADGTFSLHRANIAIKTEFDSQLPALEPQRVYDRLMWKVGTALPPFAEVGIARAIGEGARKEKLRKSVLAPALGDSITLAPKAEVEGALFFELPKEVKTLKYSTLVIGEVVNQKTGRRAPLRLPLAANQ
jgi:hypothetical protein